MSLPSRHAIGSIVLFEPRIMRIDNSTKGSTTSTPIEHGVKAKIVGVHFGDGKVTYDLAVECDDQDSGFYEVLPIRNVDSFMVLDLPKLKAVA